MKLSENARLIKNNKNISKQIAEWQFNVRYGKKYKDTKAWKVFKDKYIKEWTDILLQNEYVYDEELKYKYGIDFEDR